MTQTASNYGTVLFELGVKKEIVEKTKEIFSLTEELPKIVSKDAKHRLIEDIFPEEIRNFLKVVSDHQEMDLMDDIFVAYKKTYDENHGILCAEMSYVMEPDAKQVEQMKAYLANKYGKQTEVGKVIWVGDGIATVYGIEHAMYGEIVIFENGIRGMVQDIRRDQVGCIILGKDTEIKEGTKVTRTKKKAGVPVGDAYIGRIINALGAPIDGKGEIHRS